MRWYDHLQLTYFHLCVYYDYFHQSKKEEFYSSTQLENNSI